MRWGKCLAIFILLLIASEAVFSQQLKLGKNPYTVQKSAVLELNSDNQGLLLVRISDTALINSLTPPDGMIIFFTPSSQLFVRSEGYWKPLSYSSALNNYWAVGGNSVSGHSAFGTTSSHDVRFITNNTENMRLTAAGRLGIGSTNPGNFLEVAGTNAATGVSGLRLLNLGTATAAPATNKVLSVNSSGDVVVTDNPTVYNWSMVGNAGTNAATNFLGTTDDKPMIFKSNNTAFLEFGRRQTLGLVQSYPDYTNPDEAVMHIKSAVQFYAPAASFYKPKIFVDGSGNFRAKGSSAGTDFFEFGATGLNNDGGFEFIIGDDGDEPILFKSYHHINGMSEMMRLQSGRMAVGSNAFNATHPEKLLIDAGVTNSYNLMAGKGSINNYLQINIQNRSSGSSASSDLVATADNGDESVNYVDLGINSSAFSNTSYPIIGGANNAYLYSTGNDFVIGNATAAKNLRFFTGGYANTNERLRIDGNGNIGVNNTAPTEKLDVTGNIRFSGALMPGNSAGTSGYILRSNGAGAAPTWIDPATISSGSTNWTQDGNNVTAVKTLGTTSNFDLPFITNSTEKMRLSTSGFLGIGTTNPSGRLHMVSQESEFGDDYLFDDYTNTTTAGLFFRRARGTVASPQNLQNGDMISSLRFVPRYNGGLGYSAGSSLEAYYKGTGTNNLTDLRFSTSGVERMRMDENGSIGIGTSTFNATNPEKLFVDAGTSTYNATVIKGTINNYLRLNIQNRSTGASASSDIVATANNGTETTNYINMGINGSGNTSGFFGSANDAYIYNMGQNLLVGTGTAGKSLIFMTGGSSQASNERMRITGTGNVGIGGDLSDSYSFVEIRKTMPSGGEGVLLTLNSNNGTTNAGGSLQFKNSGAGYTGAISVVDDSQWSGRIEFRTNNNNGGSSANTLPLTSADTRMVIKANGRVGIATTTPQATLDVEGTFKLGSSGTVLSNIIKGSVAINDATTFTYTTTRQVTVTVTGATTNATVILNPRTALPVGLGIAWSRVSAANTVTIGFFNTDGTARSIGNVTFDITIIQ